MQQTQVRHRPFFLVLLWRCTEEALEQDTRRVIVWCQKTVKSMTHFHLISDSLLNSDKFTKFEGPTLSKGTNSIILVNDQIMFRFRYFGSFGRFGSFGTETSLPKHQKPNNFGRNRTISAKNHIFTQIYFGVSVRNTFRSITIS